MNSYKEKLWVAASAIAYASAVFFVLWVLVYLYQLSKGVITLKFIFTKPASGMTEGGIATPLFGSLYLALWVAILSAPVGIMSGVYLAEFAPENRTTQVLRSAIRTLSGVPAIVYGLFGLAFFVRALNMGLSLIASALTLAVMNLPVIITTTEESLRLVPNAQKEGAISLGASSWRVWRDISFRYTVSGMLSGVFLALSRALGETAPILLTGVVFYQPSLYLDPSKTFMALPYHIFILATQHTAKLKVLPIAAGAGFVLMSIVLILRVIGFIYKRRVQQWLK